MKRLLITQRRQKDKYNQDIDVIEANYIDYFTQSGFIVIPIPNSLLYLDYSMYREVDCIVFSGGEDFSYDDTRYQLEMELLKYAIAYSKPVLGICRGSQVLNTLYGGTLCKLTKDHGKIHEIEFLTDIGDFSNGDKTLVNSYHNYGIEKLGDDLDAFAFSKTSGIEAFCGTKHKVIGAMWHPERDVSMDRKVDDYLIEFLKMG